MLADMDRARAARYFEACNAAIIRASAARRQGVGPASGDRSPVGLACAPVDLVSLSVQRGARVEAVTPIGYKTAVRARSRALAGLPQDHPHIIVAGFLAAAFERVGAVGGGSFEGGDTKGGQSDGGVTTRIKHSARLRMIEAIANGWDIDARHGVVVDGDRKTVLAPRRGAGKRQQILAFPFLVAVCVEGLDLADVLVAHGWSVQSKHTKILSARLGDLLDDIGRVMVGGRGRGV